MRLQTGWPSVATHPDNTVTSGEMPELSPESEYANRFHLISRMADDLAHEIKNPLNSMVINLEVLRARARRADMDAVLGRADVLESEIHRLHRLVDGLLKLVRPERTAEGSVALDPLLEELGELVGLQAKLSRKSLEVTTIGDDAIVGGRRDTIRFALLNLLAGELQHVPADGEIRAGGHIDAGEVAVLIESVTGTASESAHAAAADAHNRGPGGAEVGSYEGEEIARALLATISGTVEVTIDGAERRTVTVRLPRVGRA